VPEIAADGGVVSTTRAAKEQAVRMRLPERHLMRTKEREVAESAGEEKAHVVRVREGEPPEDCRRIVWGINELG
jgi:hypothetical protein